MHGKTEVVQVLIPLDADLSLKEGDGKTALEIASLCETTDDSPPHNRAAPRNALIARCCTAFRLLRDRGTLRNRFTDRGGRKSEGHRPNEGSKRG